MLGQGRYMTQLVEQQHQDWLLPLLPEMALEAVSPALSGVLSVGLAQARVGWRQTGDVPPALQLHGQTMLRGPRQVGEDRLVPLGHQVAVPRLLLLPAHCYHSRDARMKLTGEGTYRVMW